MAAEGEGPGAEVRHERGRIERRRLGDDAEARDARAVAILPEEFSETRRGLEPGERIDGALEPDEGRLVVVREATERLRDRADAPAIVHGADPW
jgi:hypothetical protein